MTGDIKKKINDNFKKMLNNKSSITKKLIIYNLMKWSRFRKLLKIFIERIQQFLLALQFSLNRLLINFNSHIAFENYQSNVVQPSWLFSTCSSFLTHSKLGGNRLWFWFVCSFFSLFAVLYLTRLNKPGLPINWYMLLRFAMAV